MPTTFHASVIHWTSVVAPGSSPPAWSSAPLGASCRRRRLPGHGGRGAGARLDGRADFLLGDLRSMALPTGVDLVFSTATLHWVPDHPSLWRRLRAGLAPGGRLEVQYGAAGNIAAVVETLPLVATRPPFAAHLAPYALPWTFDTPEAARRELREAGFTDIQVWTEKRIARPPDPRTFLATSILPTDLARLPPPLRNPFVDAVFTALGRPQHYLYVRLNASAAR